MIGCFAGVVGAAAILWRKRCFRLVLGVYLPLLKVVTSFICIKCLGLLIHLTFAMVSLILNALLVGRKEQSLLQSKLSSGFVPL